MSGIPLFTDPVSADRVQSALNFLISELNQLTQGGGTFNNPTITGGTINGTTIGLTTPAAAHFTALEATSIFTSGNIFGQGDCTINGSFEAVSTTAAVYLQLLSQGSTGGAGAIFYNWNGSSSGSVASLSFITQGGTSPTSNPLNTGDIVGEILWESLANHSFMASIIATASGTQTGSSAPTKLSFYTCPVGTTMNALAFALLPDGTTQPSGNVTQNTVGKGFIQKAGTNGRAGTVTLNGATTVTVSNTSVTLTDFIGFSLNTLGGTQGAQPKVTSIQAGTSFTVLGTAADTSVYNYSMFGTN